LLFAIFLIVRGDISSYFFLVIWFYAMFCSFLLDFLEKKGKNESWVYPVSGYTSPIDRHLKPFLCNYPAPIV
jgi:hypothetical protein